MEGLFLFLMKTGVLPLGILALFLGAPVPICSVDDPRYDSHWGINEDECAEVRQEQEINMDNQL